MEISSDAMESLDGDMQTRCGTDRSCDRRAGGAMQRAPPWETPGDHRPEGQKKGGEAAEITTPAKLRSAKMGYYYWAYA
ncbi:hypothetical protein NL676_023827 [Syzygium grande]|nr:hypothetical protein NL676_023827 [Syzygium grande]